MTVDVPGIALQAGDCGDSHARGKEGIFAVGFFRASPTRIAGEVEHRAKNLADASRSGFVASSGENLMNQFGVPSAGEAECLREAGAAVLHESMKGFAHEE